MESSRIKERKLILVSSYVSSPWPDLPARFESLNDDTLTTVLKFVGNNSYRSFGGLNKHCKEVYIASGMTKNTFLFGYAPLSVIIDRIERGPNIHKKKAHLFAWTVDLMISLLHRHPRVEQMDWVVLKNLAKGVVYYNRRDVLPWLLQQRKKFLLKEICDVAAKEGRIGILDEVWNNLDDVYDKLCAFHSFDDHAAESGKLDVLKWVEEKGLYSNEEGFTVDKYGYAIQAAFHGRLHDLQWLKEEKGFELKRKLYCNAACGGQLHVMKWLREQEVDWSERTFPCAAKKGNLDVLQWLHDEGCPWPEDERVDTYLAPEHRLKPEVLEWLRANGYGGRIRIHNTNDPLSDLYLF